MSHTWGKKPLTFAFLRRSRDSLGRPVPGLCPWVWNPAPPLLPLAPEWQQSAKNPITRTAGCASARCSPPQTLGDPRGLPELQITVMLLSGPLFEALHCIFHSGNQSWGGNGGVQRGTGSEWGMASEWVSEWVSHTVKEERAWGGGRRELGKEKGSYWWKEEGGEHVEEYRGSPEQADGGTTQRQPQFNQAGIDQPQSSASYTGRQTEHSGTP